MQAIEAIIAELREELVGNFPREKTLNKVTGEKVKDIDALKNPAEIAGDETQKLREMTLQLLNLIYNNDFDGVDQLNMFWQFPREIFKEISQLGFDLCAKLNQVDICYKIAESFPIDSHRASKAVQLYLNKLLIENKLRKASTIWNSFKKNDIPSKGIENVIISAFKRAMKFPATTINRDYSTAFQLVQLFELSKNVTFSLSNKEYEFNMKNENYYVSALIAKNLNLPNAMIHRAALRAFNRYFKIFKLNLENGEYEGFTKLSPNDPYSRSRSIIDEFNTYDIDNQALMKDSKTINKIASAAFVILEKLMTDVYYRANSDYARITFIIRLIIDYKLTSNQSLIKANRYVNEKTSWLMAFIQTKIKDLPSANNYTVLLKELYNNSSVDHTVYKETSETLFLKFVELKETKKAADVFKHFNIYLENLTGQLATIASVWIETGDFDTLINTVEKFNIIHELEKTPGFKEKIINYYKRAIKEQRPVKSNVISTMFGLKREMMIAPYLELIEEKLEDKNINEAIRIFKEKGLKRKESIAPLLKIYKKHVSQDKDFAINMRRNFNIGINDIGLLNWFKFEILGLSPKFEPVKEKMKRPKKPSRKPAAKKPQMPQKNKHP